ncbi:MAG: methyltransferase domain-containing protein [Candidatus Solibacter sp.]
MSAAEWNARLYDSSHGFVWQFGRDLLGMLAPQPEERILDVGCGTGQLAAEIARSGAGVLGIDSSAAMIAQARVKFPAISFETRDVHALAFDGEFDAVFSNAVLHWVRPPEAAAAAMIRAVRPGGRMVLEFGGHGNIPILMSAACHALSRLGVADPERLNPWYFPSIAEYSAILEANGLEVSYAQLFDRPTALEDGEQGLANWYRMFGGTFLGAIPDAAHADFHRMAAEFAAPSLWRDGHWTADYRRLRIAGHK